MQRLAKPSDYVSTDVLGKPMYTIPWETRLCPGNPADDPQDGALLYNEFVLAQANGEQSRTPEQQVDEIVAWTLATPGEAARKLAVDLAAAYQGKYQFRIEDLEHWDLETKSFRAHLIFHNQDLRSICASRVMALRGRSTT